MGFTKLTKLNIDDPSTLPKEDTFFIGINWSGAIDVYFMLDHKIYYAEDYEKIKREDIEPHTIVNWSYSPAVIQNHLNNSPLY